MKNKAGKTIEKILRVTFAENAAEMERHLCTCGCRLPRECLIGW